MDRKWNVIGLALAALVMSGCATMSGDECMATDWSAVGYEDGARGFTTERFSKHRKACAKHGVTADFGAYQSGRDQGLVEYCQPGRGFDVGSNGGRYYGVCSADLEADFLDAYNDGVRVAEINVGNRRIDLTLKGGAEALTGWPDAVHRRIGHPVVWIGRFVDPIKTSLQHLF